MSRRSLTDLMGSIVLSGASLLGCDAQVPGSITQSVSVPTVSAEEVNDKNSVQIQYGKKIYTVSCDNDNYTILDPSGKQITDNRLLKPIVYTFLVCQKVSEFNKEELDEIAEQNKKLILEAQVSRIWGAAKRIVKGDDELVSAVNKGAGKAYGIGRETIETMIDLSTDPVFFAQGAVIYDLNATQEDFEWFKIHFDDFRNNLQTKEPFSDGLADGLYGSGPIAEPVNTSSPAYLKALKTASIELDSEDKEVVRSLRTLPESVRKRETKRLAEKIETRIRESKEFQDYAANIERKSKSWAEIYEKLDRLKPLEEEVINWIGDYSTPEKAVISLYEAAKRRDKKECKAHGYGLPLEDVVRERDGVKIVDHSFLSMEMLQGSKFEIVETRYGKIIRSDKDGNIVEDDDETAIVFTKWNYEGEKSELDRMEFVRLGWRKDHWHVLSESTMILSESELLKKMLKLYRKDTYTDPKIIRDSK